MISCLTELGRVGLTAVGDSPADADALFRRAERILARGGRAGAGAAASGGLTAARPRPRRHLGSPLARALFRVYRPIG